MSTTIMGVLNVTPDSFYDGGRYLNVEQALLRARQLVDDGAEWLDIGAESTRPGSEPVALEEELARLMPVVEGLVGQVPVRLSVDTSKSEVAASCLQAGVQMVNDVTGLSDPAMADVVANYDASVVIMHSIKTPKTMQENPRYGHVVDDICAFFEQRLERAVKSGIPLAQIWLDPGLGFGKTVDHNLQIVKALNRFKRFGCSLMLGASRKSFIGTVLNLAVEDRLEGSLAVYAWALFHGVDVLRVHDVVETRRFVDMFQAISSVQLEGVLG